MPDVKLTVTADTSGVNQAVNNVTQQADKAGKVINRAPKWSPVDLKAQEDAYRKAEQLFAAHLKKMEALQKRFNVAPGGSAGAGAGGSGGGANPPLPPLPPPPPPLPGNPPARRGRHAYTYSPDLSDIGRNLISGFGGGFGMVSQYATRGAIAGANAPSGGGLMGGGMGLLKGFGIGSLALGALKLGQMGSEGMDMAKERNSTLDTLKRQMGDLGVSFSMLKAVSEAAADGMGINSKEAAQLAQQFDKLSRGAETSAEGLTDAVRTGAGLGKAYGIAPSAGVDYLAGMRNIDPRQNNRELAIMLADTIARSGMNAKADEVMRSMTAFAQATTRMSMSDPNMGAYSNAYSSLMGQHYAGMTGDAAAGLLQQANGAMMHMGGMGEASQNFTYAAFRNAGGRGLNPFTARTLAEGGLFGSRASAFADGTPMARLYGRMGVDVGQLAGGRGANTTNLEAIVSQIERSGMKPEVKNDMLRNYFGLGSDQQSAALYNMALDGKGRADGGLLGQIQRAGIDPKSINAGGLQTMAQVGKAGSVADLQSIYGAMAKRSGKAALTGDDEKLWKNAQGDFGKMQEALLKISASKDKEETDASRMNDSIKAVETAQTKVGDALLIPLNAIRDGMLALTKTGSMEGLHAKVVQIHRDEINDHYNEQAKVVTDRAMKAGRDAMANGGVIDPKSAKALVDGKAALAAIEASRNAALKKLDADEAAATAGGKVPPDDQLGTSPGSSGAPSGDRRARIAAMEKAHGMPAGMLLGMWGTESSFGKNIGRSSAGATGHFQFIPETAKRYGVKSGDFDSELDGAARYMDDLHKQKGGWKEAATVYNGATHSKMAADAYWRSIEKNGGFHLGDATPMDVRGGAQGAQGAGGAVNVTVTVKQQTIDARGGVSERVAGTTQVSKPRGAGSINVEAAH